MKRYRITARIYIVSGEGFKITDDWLKPGNAHRLLKGSWTGVTEFQEIPEYIEDTIAPNKSESNNIRGGVSFLGLLGPSSTS